jgi:hypothetical protein
LKSLNIEASPLLSKGWLDTAPYAEHIILNANSDQTFCLQFRGERRLSVEEFVFIFRHSEHPQASESGEAPFAEFAGISNMIIN